MQLQNQTVPLTAKTSCVSPGELVGSNLASICGWRIAPFTEPLKTARVLYPGRVWRMPPFVTALISHRTWDGLMLRGCEKESTPSTKPEASELLLLAGFSCTGNQR